MDDLLGEFLVETGEQLEELDACLVRFEADPNDAEMLKTIFRVAHTIKGTCGFFDLPRIAKLAHAVEALMSGYRDGAPVSSAGVTVVLASLERLKQILAVLGRDGTEPEGNDDDLIQALTALAEGDIGTINADTGPDTSPGSPVHNHLDALERAWQEELVAPADPAQPFDASPAVDTDTEVISEERPIAEAQPKALRVQSVRVAVDTLETLMTTVSELVLARNQLMDVATHADEPAFAAPLQRLSAVTVELQDAIMKARLQPIANAWQKLPVIVRTLSTELGKPMEITMSGGDTELDRQVLEAIKDPLTHMVRNAADHGLENPEERIEAGKPEMGRITLKASQQRGNIVVEVSDDGRGLDVGAVRRKAVANGLATTAELDALQDEEIYDLIFQPGFSTAETVSEISGRGVGMDVVRSNIESIGGTVALASTSPKGTTFVIRIPLTLAIMSALIVDVAGMRFAIPQFSIAELVRVGDVAAHPVETINGAAVLHLRDRLIPLLDFAAELDLRRQDWRDINAAGGTAVILHVGTQRFGILVDAASRTEEIVVKPVCKLLRPIGMYSGGTIFGDGSVIMIVDPRALSEMIGPMEGVEDDTIAAAPVAQADNRTAMLLFRAGSPGLKALPLSLITRLEEIPAKAIETCDAQQVIQYRGGLLPLVRLDDAEAPDQPDMLPVLVFSEGTRAAGLVVDEIVDIVEEPLSIALQSDGDGIAGSAVVRDQAVEIVDVSHYLGSILRQQGAGLVPNTDSPPRVLLVDDGQFFRDMLAPLLRGSGYAVTTASSGQEALDLKEAGIRFDIVVSDIEMPGMDGLELARAIRADSAWDSVPLIGLSSQQSPRLSEASRLAGFDVLVGKFDRRSLMQVLGNWREFREEAA
ncbi:hypothetical protein AUC70_13120 [Methyloceanibacter stevinii]|uniref:Chemotaxis protein CheA n=1 Tax=Methyloceanibacter stevinii TaxID=1774970 RepID=A0A1E3VUJ7_9HYPH|nr:chemotaxis protein CheW [Methyloceanibacter stevinii]ODR97197.1 hypothetical protein AUC70_13120 [Methyloceanibacter stevinii]